MSDQPTASVVKRWASAIVRAAVVLLLSYGLGYGFWYLALSALLPRGFVEPGLPAAALSLLAAVPLALVQFWLAYRGEDRPPPTDEATGRRPLPDAMILAPPAVVGAVTLAVMAAVAWLGVSPPLLPPLLATVGGVGTLVAAAASAWCGWLTAGSVVRRGVLALGGAAVGFLGHVLAFVIAGTVTELLR